MNDFIELNGYNLATAYLFVIVLMVIVRIKKIPREREIVIATVRMTLQLIIVGYILEYVFRSAYPLLTIVLVGIMLAFAIYTLMKRSKYPLTNKMKWLIAYSMIAGVLASLAFFILVVLQLAPWYEPTYVIPVAGMIIGNSMTGIALGVNTLSEGMRSRKAWIEGALMLGAKPRDACRDIINRSFDAALLPTINSMVGMGIIFLPGMMTGQILGGASPIVAVKYQIVIMLGVVGSISLAVILLVQFGYRTFFNDRDQLVVGEDR